MKRFVRKYFPRRLQSLLRRLYYRFPLIRRLYYFPADVRYMLKGKRRALLPPPSKIFIGDGHFEEIGQEFLGYFIDLAGLKPGEKVLEVGSGIGRMAIPLTGYLEAGGEYRGIDIVKEGVSWCRKNITPRFPHFHFQLADVYNRLYHPKGKARADEYRFPYADGYFDFVFLTSVFTHMVPGELEHYLSEIARVLKKGGRCLATYFLITPEARAFLASGQSKFSQEFAGCRVIDQHIPEASIAYEETYIRQIYEKNGLQVSEPIYYGAWAKRKEFLSSQDIVLCKKINSLKGE